MTPADQLLLDGIRRGDEDAWGRLVRLYQGRLIAFATQSTPDPADAEDAVQDAFVSFLKQLTHYRGDASIESYLFRILRSRLIDRHRKAMRRPCRLGSELSATHDAVARWTDHGPTPSDHAGRNEADAQQQTQLAAALRSVTQRYQDQRDFEKLRVTEMLFYAQLGPTDIAKHTDTKPNTVATIKRRTLQRIADALSQAPQAGDTGPNTSPNTASNTAPLADNLLTAAWEAARPSCPKRSTVGAYLLGSLDPDWHAYVGFHLDTLGCRFCRANHDDLQSQTQAAENDHHTQALHERLLRSSIGFLKPSG